MDQIHTQMLPWSYSEARLKYDPDLGTTSSLQKYCCP